MAETYIIKIQTVEGKLLVDSRLIAEELGIKHSDWFRNVILKYQQEVEEDWGILRFENGKFLEGSMRGRPERYALLTEQQATLLMTYSRNTDRVRQCKRKLVKAFEAAKQAIQTKPISGLYWYERLKLFRARTTIPVGWWSIFEETIDLIGDLEHFGFVAPDDMILDISVGKCWANHLRSHRLNPRDVGKKYLHYYPGWEKPVRAYIYPNEYLPEFREWLAIEYVPTGLPAYLKSKQHFDALPAANSMVQKLLRG